MAIKHPRILLVTNDFPPTVGGIQSYLRDYAATLDPARLVVFASTQDRNKAAQFDSNVPYPVVRWPRKVMLPTPATVRRMQQLIREHDIHTVWFGAAAPLALMAAAARAAGAKRVVASTHGHEVGWSMFPGTRQALGVIGRDVDVLTYVSRYARNRLAAAFGPAAAWEPMPGGVNADTFTPQPQQRAELRARYGLTRKKVIVAVSRIVARKGQDTLVNAMPQILRSVPDAHLLIVGPGNADGLRRRVEQLGISTAVTITGAVDYSELAGHYCAGDVFALPVRTQLGGLSVEGLGIVFLEAQACGVPTVAGDGGGAPETVVDGHTGVVVNGRDHFAVATSLSSLLLDAPLRAALAANGKEHVNREWSWERLATQCRFVMSGQGSQPPNPLR
ncbi:glycosyltransferase family 4 protein [Corynebacterium auriscanis]|uniref:glycosyltransferase family 4 protein n=1 Tax=Corynebacterium auriscanis TaxID=99807 RepID=UPI003CEE6C2E